MDLALALGRRGLGNAWPNPAVGAVVVDAAGDVPVIVGRGWTQPGGRPHAEVEALARAGSRARGATLYVTLEPCSHHGQTPPCADAIIAAGIARVVSAIEDPNPEVAGEGHARLRAHGIAVEVGLREAEARHAHAGHFRRVRDGRPASDPEARRVRRRQGWARRPPAGGDHRRARAHAGPSDACDERCDPDRHRDRARRRPPAHLPAPGRAGPLARAGRARHRAPPAGDRARWSRRPRSTPVWVFAGTDADAKRPSSASSGMGSRCCAFRRRRGASIFPPCCGPSAAAASPA